MNWIEERAKIQVILQYIGLGILVIGILILVIIWIYSVIEDKKRERKEKGIR